MLGGRRDARSAGASALEARSALGVAADAERDAEWDTTQLGLVKCEAGVLAAGEKEAEEGLVADTKREA